ncbi:hypothetical protein PBI_SPORTO_72 [Arthrobacter phage Sporto]|nr:hypothetical protein PBI_SPORTO_72 [Arthrobacter phage Sporto]
MQVHGEILIHECDNNLPHYAHDWRWGFLKLKKGSCLGITPAQFDQWIEAKYPTPMSLFARPKAKHKHRFQYKPSQLNIWVNPDRYVWICKDQTCDVIISSEKEELRHALTAGGEVFYPKRIVTYRKPGWPLN